MTEEKAISNFKTLWLKFDVSSSDKHQIFFKEHSVRNQEARYPKGKTLFVLNLPPYVNSEGLKNVFSRNCGPVKSATFLPSLGGFKSAFNVAYVVFAKETGLEKALNIPRDYSITLHDDESKTPEVGIQKWIKEYNAQVMNEEKVMKQSIEKYMEKYDKIVEARLAVEENPEENDGWTTVSNKKKRGQFAPSRKESTIEKIQTTEERKNKKKKLLNFYTFQIRESKKQHLADLRKKFELDKKKLQTLKSKRTFKPFK